MIPELGSLSGLWLRVIRSLRVGHKNNAKTFSSSLQTLCITQVSQMAGLGTGLISSLFSLSFHLPSFL